MKLLQSLNNFVELVGPELSNVFRFDKESTARYTLEQLIEMPGYFIALAYDNENKEFVIVSANSEIKGAMEIEVVEFDFDEIDDSDEPVNKGAMYEQHAHECFLHAAGVEFVGY